MVHRTLTRISPVQIWSQLKTVRDISIYLSAFPVVSIKKVTFSVVQFSCVVLLVTNLMHTYKHT